MPLPVQSIAGGAAPNLGFAHGVPKFELRGSKAHSSGLPRGTSPSLSGGLTLVCPLLNRPPGASGRSTAMLSVIYVSASTYRVARHMHWLNSASYRCKTPS